MISGVSDREKNFFESTGGRRWPLYIARKFFLTGGRTEKYAGAGEIWRLRAGHWPKAEAGSGRRRSQDYAGEIRVTQSKRKEHSAACGRAHGVRKKYSGYLATDEVMGSLCH